MAVRLLDVAPYPVFPPTRGGAIAIHHANLAVSASVRVYLISQGLRRSELRRALSGAWSFQHTPTYHEDRIFSLASLVVGYASGQRGGGSMLSADRTLHLARPRFLRGAMEQADVIQVEHPWQVPTIARWSASRRPLVMVAHNAETAMAEQLACPRRKIEAIRKRESQALAACDAVIVFSDDDRTWLAELPGSDSKKLHVIPLGVDVDRIRPASSDEKAKAKSALGLEKKRVILFVGSLYGPNVEAAGEVYRIAQILNRTDVAFVIAGRVGERFRSNDRVLVTGDVDHVEPYFAAADIAINPMRSGGGMQVKLLEFLAAGLPTVTTPVGARGVKVVSGRDALVTAVDGFPNALITLLADESGAANIGQAGRALVQDRYRWDAIARSRVDLYQGLMACVSPS